MTSTNIKSIALLKFSLTQQSRAVRTRSRALANVFSIELRDLRNSEVTIPIAALFITINSTVGTPRTFANSYKHNDYPF